MRFVETPDSQTFADQPPSSEGFDQLPFYIAENKYLLAAARTVQRILSVGIGTGSDILWLSELGKIRSPFSITGIDPNEIDLAKASSRLSGLVNKVKGDSLTLIRGGANEVRRIISGGSVDLVTALNSMHLYDDVADFFSQAYEVLLPEGSLLGNTAYAKDVMFPDPNTDARAWGNVAVLARIDLKAQGFTDIPRPVDPARYTSKEIISMAESVGFKISSEVRNVFIPRDEAEQLVTVDEFAVGVLPCVPLNFAREVLRKAVGRALDRSGALGLHRGWLHIHGVIPS